MREKRLLHVYAPGSSKEYDRRWNRIWRLKAQSKVKYIAWRACGDTLPIRVNLFRRRLKVDVYCPFCGEHYETQTHIFLDCLVAKDVWGKSPFRLNIEESPQLNFEELCFYLCDAFGNEVRGLLLTFLLVIWKSRNKWVFLKHTGGTL